VQIGHPALAAAAAQAATHFDGRKALSEARDEGSEIEDAPMFAATANRYERHSGGCNSGCQDASCAAASSDTPLVEVAAPRFPGAFAMLLLEVREGGLAGAERTQLVRAVNMELVR
jgi:hypothetical protein